MSPLCEIILVVILIIALLGGFSGRFRGYGYGYGHGGIGVLGVILIVVVVLLLTDGFSRPNWLIVSIFNLRWPAEYGPTVRSGFR